MVSSFRFFTWLLLLVIAQYSLSPAQLVVAARKASSPSKSNVARKPQHKPADASDNLEEIVRITNAIEAENPAAYLIGRRTCQASVSNFMLGLVTAKLDSLGLSRNYFKVLHPEDSKDANGNIWSYAMRGQIYDYTESGAVSHTLHMKDTVDSDERNDVTQYGIGDFILTFTSLYYLLRQDPLRNFFVGMMLGRIYFARKLKNEFTFPKAYQIALSLQSNAASRFTADRAMENRFFVTRDDVAFAVPKIANKSFSVDGEVAVVAAKDRKGLCYLAGKNGQCWQILNLGADNCSAEPVQAASNLLTDVDKVFATGVVNNYQIWPGVPVIRGAASFGRFAHLAASVTGLPSANDDYGYAPLTGGGSPFQILDAPLIKSEYFLDNFDKVVIPVVSDDAGAAFLITPVANVIGVNGQGKLRRKDRGLGLVHLRGACLDLAANKDVIAFLGVGRVAPKLKSANQLAPFDPFLGDNYFAYLRLVKNENVFSEGKFLSADGTMEGGAGHTRDKDIIFTDLDLQKDKLLENDYLKFVDFDAEGNLFVLTGEGRILYFQMLAADGNKKQYAMRFLRVPPVMVTADNNQAVAETFDYMSCGDGIVVRGKSDGSLYYLTSEELATLMNSPKELAAGPTWNKCCGDLKAANFAHLNDGALLLYGGSSHKKLYFIEKSAYRVSLAELIAQINNSTKLNATDKSLQLLAQFCHLVLKKANRHYFNVTLPDQPYPFITSAGQAVDFFAKLSVAFPQLYFKIWAQEPTTVDVLEQAIDKLRVTFQDSAAVQEAVNKFQDQFLAKSIYFGHDSFRRVLQKLANSRVVPKGLAAYGKKIESVVQNADYISSKTGFASLDELLQADADGDAKTGKIGAAIMLEWLNLHKAELAGAFPASYPKWIDTLQKITQASYSGVQVAKSAEVGLAKIEAAMELFGEAAELNDLGPRDKTAVIKALQDLVDNLNFVAQDHVASIKEGLSFLRDKFSLANDASIGSRFENLFNQVCVNYDVRYLFDKFRAGLVDLAAASSGGLGLVKNSASPTSDVSALVLKQFELLQSMVRSRGDFEVLPGGNDLKAQALAFLQNEVNTNSFLRSYDLSLASDQKANSFACLVSKLAEPAFADDFLYSLVEFSKRAAEVPEDKKVVIQAILERLWQAFGASCFARADAEKINGCIDIFNKSGMNFAKLDERAVSVTFPAFLKQRQQEARANLDSNSGWWATEGLQNGTQPLSLFAFWDVLGRYHEFGLNFTIDRHKYRLVSLFTFIKASIAHILQDKTLDQALRARLAKMNDEVMAQAKLLV